MYNMKPLIQRFRDQRKRLGINQTEFARRLGVSLATITRWERANMVYTPDLRQLSLIAELFEMTVCELLTPDPLDTVTPDDTKRTVSNDEGVPPTASDVMTDKTPQPPDIPSPVADDTQKQESYNPSFSAGDEAPQETAFIESSEPVSNDGIQEAPLIVIPEDLKPESDTPQLGTDDELLQSEMVPESQELLNNGEMTEVLSDIPEEPQQGQAADTINHDETITDTEAVSAGITEIAPIITNDEAPTGQFASPIVNSDANRTGEAPAPELLEIVSPDENPTVTETPLTDPDSSVSGLPPIASSDEIREPSPDPTVAPLDADKFISNDEEGPVNMSNVMNDEIQRERTSKPATPSFVSSNEMPEEQPTDPIIIHDDLSEPVTVDEGTNTPPTSHDETSPEESPAPELFSIITSDETPGEGNPQTPDADTALQQEAVAPETSITANRDEFSEISGSTPAESAKDILEKPWESLGISRAWYYRLKQRGRLEKYIQKNK